jgi:hypothetical protein
MKYSLGEHNSSTLSQQILKENLNPVFFETGTNVGRGVLEATEAGFKKIVSIEIDTELHDKSKKKFLDNQNYSGIEFQFHLGDSRILLPKLIETIDEKITFWLDGHEFYSIPLVEELTSIKNHKIKDHTILIDDVRMFDSHEWNKVGHQNIINLIMEINKDYKISYYDSPHGHNDILVARI